MLEINLSKLYNLAKDINRAAKKKGLEFKQEREEIFLECDQDIGTIGFLQKGHKQKYKPLLLVKLSQDFSNIIFEEMLLSRLGAMPDYLHGLDDHRQSLRETIETTEKYFQKYVPNGKCIYINRHEDIKENA